MRKAVLAAGMLVLSAASLSLAQTIRNPRELGVQDSQRIVRLLGVRPGDSVAAVGASSSFLLTELSEAAGSGGRVFVVDWDRTAIQGIQHLIDQNKLSNVTAIVGDSPDALLPERADKVLLINSYRLLDNRERFFAANRKYFTDDARLAVIDFYRRPMTIGPPVRERVASHRVMRELKRFGYVLVDRHNISSYQYFLVYRPRKT